MSYLCVCTASLQCAVPIFIPQMAVRYQLFQLGHHHTSERARPRGHSHWLPRPRPGRRHRKSTQAQAPHASGCTLSDSVPDTGVAAHNGVLAASVPVTRNVGSLLYAATVVCDSHRLSQTDCSHAANSGPTTALALDRASELYHNNKPHQLPFSIRRPNLHHDLALSVLMHQHTSSADAKWTTGSCTTRRRRLISSRRSLVTVLSGHSYHPAPRQGHQGRQQRRRRLQAAAAARLGRYPRLRKH